MNSHLNKMQDENTEEIDPHDIFDTGNWPPNARLLSCDICDQKFSNKLKIVAHWCTTHKYKMCGFCTNYAFKYESDKIQHERQHVPFCCSLCSFEFNKICEESISEHYNKAHQSYLCTFCSSVIQPSNQYPEHAEKKHNVLSYNDFSVRHELFELVIDGDDDDPDPFFYCYMCDKKKRLNLLFGHYVFYHNVSIHSLKRSLDATHSDVAVNGSVLSSTLDRETSNDIEEDHEFKETCTVCENPFNFDEITKELHGVFCKGYVVCSIKDCNQTFETINELKTHLDHAHSVLSCKFGCASSELKPIDINNHLESCHDLVECFLCNIVISSSTFKNHLRDKHNVNVAFYEQAMLKTSSKLFLLEEKQVMCIFCNYDLTKEIFAFSFLNHYKNQHDIQAIDVLRNLEKNPIIDLILSSKQTKFDEECLQNFIVKLSYESLIETDFDASKVYCIGVEHVEEKPTLDFGKQTESEHNTDDDDDEGLLTQLLTCEFCKKKFSKACKFYEHLTELHGFRLMNVNACDKCKIQNSETLTDSGVDNKNFNLSLVCPYDMTNHVTKNNFTDHMIFEHSQKALTGDIIIYKCHVCNFAYKSLKEIRNHFNVDHPNIVMNYCRICRFKLASSNESDHFARNHAEDMKRVERFCCKICKKEFKKESTAKYHYLKSHKKKETKRKPCYKCQNASCSETFDNKEDRKMHQIFAHPDEKMFACKQCPMKFATKSSLSSHNMVHKNVINTCEFCQKTFLRRDSFKEHLLIHSDLRLKCSFCDKVFVQRSNLVRHERIHLNDKPYRCSFCDKTFSDKGACTSHEKVHTKTEHADCEVCGKHFARKQKLKYHMRLHTLENILTCECGKIFPESYSYRKHRETHQNKNESTKCKICFMTFKSKRSKIKHEQNEHGEDASGGDEGNDSEGGLIQTRIQCTICNLNDFTTANIKEHLVDVHQIEMENDWQNYITEVEFKMDVE